jgi:hypothetical protein
MMDKSILYLLEVLQPGQGLVVRQSGSGGEICIAYGFMRVWVGICAMGSTEA